MKKLIVAIVILLALAVPVLAASPLATLINSFGDKVIVASGSSEAQDFFAKGYVLMGNPFQPKECVCPDVGASTVISARTTFQDGIDVGAIGGKVLNASTTLRGPLTMTAAQVCNNNVITVNSAAVAGTVAAASLDITMPATSTLFTTCLKNNGDMKKLLFINASPTAASTTEFVAGTGCEGMISGDTGAADTIAGGGSAIITLMRITDYLGVNGTADCQFLIEELTTD